MDTTQNRDLLRALNKISDQIGEFREQGLDASTVAILWDVENVTPDSMSLFIEGFLEHAGQFGRVSVAQAFADWTRSVVSKLAAPLTKHHFELTHIPAARKNSADMAMITHGMELALRYPHLDTFILVTGDADFRPLVLS